LSQGFSGSGRCVDSAKSGNRIKKVPPGEAAHFFSARAWC
jgi:hypothetical protein